MNLYSFYLINGKKQYKCFLFESNENLNYRARQYSRLALNICTW